ncbi:MAG: hypothetical protein ACI9MR_002048 [Myxococcota bacterium]|jgi:hypothetical protein
MDSVDGRVGYPACFGRFCLPQRNRSTTLVGFTADGSGALWHSARMKFTTCLALAAASLLSFAACGSSETTDYTPRIKPTPPSAPARDRTPEAATAVETRTSPLDAPVDVAYPPAIAARTASGLASRVMKAGTGTRKPKARDTVVVHYTGWQTDGTRFDSSVERGTPATFPLNRVIPGWTEGLQLMVEGEQRRFWIPADMAYGSDPSSGRPTGMLVFDVELLSIQ